MIEITVEEENTGAYMSHTDVVEFSWFGQNC